MGHLIMLISGKPEISARPHLDDAVFRVAAVGHVLGRHAARKG
jgi:hypothetical protein